jgi:hypothetical protein
VGAYNIGDQFSNKRGNRMSKLRVMYIVHHFPQISETYIRSEIEALAQDCDIRVISLHQAKAPYANSAPFQQMEDPDEILTAIDEFQPHVLHSHWLLQTRILAYFGGYFSGSSVRRNIPFTIRAHSFDVLDHGGKYIREAAPMVNSDLCLGIIAFPFTRPLLSAGGIRGEKIHDCFPVVNYRRFYDRSPNGDFVMNVGACLPKKKMSDFLELASAVPHTRFNLYPLGYETPEIKRLNARMSNPVNVAPPVQPEEMLAEYKQHRWLVYTASRESNSVGWPMAVAEAQAAGVGVCFPNIRPDLKDYIGDAGFLYESVSDAARIISRPFPDELREKGFEQARKSDVFEHKAILLDLWQKAISSSRAGYKQVRHPDDGLLNWGEGQTRPEYRMRVRHASKEIDEVIPAGDTLVLIDGLENCLTGEAEDRRRVIRPEALDGESSGPPPNDEEAIRRLGDLRRSGAHFIAFAWPAFWWLDYYTGLHQHLRSNFPCILENDRLVIFDLRS